MNVVVAISSEGQIGPKTEPVAQAVIADYDAETAVERELILRLASLLWRLRRSALIETGLLQIQGEILREKRKRQTQAIYQDSALMVAVKIGYAGNSETVANAGTKPEARMPDPRLDIARCFLSLSNLDNGVFERLGRYEMGLWRQVRC